MRTSLLSSLANEVSGWKKQFLDILELVWV